MPHNIYNRSGMKNASKVFRMTKNPNGTITFYEVPIGSNPNQPKKRNKKTPGQKQKTKKNCK